MVKATPRHLRQPAPSICAEEAPICSNTIVYDYWTDDAESDEEEQKAAKRKRRIEENAASYLRGEPLFILTASLKGPFGPGWKNPWARKRQKHSHDSVGNENAPEMVVPVTAAAPALDHLLQQSPKNHVPIDDIREHQEQQREQKQQHDRSLSVSSLKPPSSVGKVSEWLRKTEELPHSQLVGLHRTSISQVKERVQTLKGSDHGSEYESAVDWRSGEAPTTTGLASLAGQAAFGQSLSFSGIFQLSGSEDEDSESPKRAEAAIIEYRRSSARHVPIATPVSESEALKLPKPVLDGGAESGPDTYFGKEASLPQDIPQPVHDPRSHVVSVRQGVVSSDHSTLKPDLSYQTSNIHSAQVVSAVPRLATQPSDVHSTEEMLPSAPLLAPNEPHTASMSTSHAGVQQPINSYGSEKENDPIIDDCSSAMDQLGDKVNREPASSQGKASSFQNFDSPKEMPAIKQIDQDTTRKTPLREHGDNKRRRGSKLKTISVKSSMRITKVSGNSIKSDALTSSAAKKLAFLADLDSSSPRHGSEAVSDAATAAAGIPSQGSNKHSSSSGLKGILKRVSASGSNSASAQSEAQPEAQQPIVQTPEDQRNQQHCGNSSQGNRRGGQKDSKDDDDDKDNDSHSDFDLDNAMDELGSYLGIWNPDEAAQKLV